MLLFDVIYCYNIVPYISCTYHLGDTIFEVVSSLYSIKISLYFKF